MIPNVNTIGDLGEIWPRLSGDEKKLFDAVARSYLASVMPDYRYRQTTVTLDVRGFAFRAAGRQPIEAGWRDAFPDWRPPREKGEEAQALPVLRDGETVRLRDPEIEDKETRPPPRYKEGTLIEAMQNAWRFVEDEALRDRLKEAKGIGTPATRGEIIAGLKKQDFLTVREKNIVPSDRGLALFGVLERADPALVDPGVTAELECLLDDVVLGKQEMTVAIVAVCDAARRIIGRLGEGAAGGAAVALGDASGGYSGKDRPPTAAMKTFCRLDRPAQGHRPDPRATRNQRRSAGRFWNCTHRTAQRGARNVTGRREPGHRVRPRSRMPRRSRGRGTSPFPTRPGPARPRCPNGSMRTGRRSPRRAARHGAQVARPGGEGEDGPGKSTAEAQTGRRGGGRSTIRWRPRGSANRHAFADSLRQQGGRVRARRPLRIGRLVCAARRRSLRLPRARVAVAPGRVAARPKDCRHGLRTDTHQPGGYIVTALMRRLRQIRALFRSHRHRCRKRR